LELLVVLGRACLNPIEEIVDHSATEIKIENPTDMGRGAI